MLSPAMKVYALCATIIGVQCLLLAFWTGTVRAQRKVFVNPEDAKLNKGSSAEADHPDVLRVKRAHQNLMENAIPFFAIGFLYAALEPTVTSARAYFFTFTACRLLHTVFYLLQKQPFRTISFAIGALATLGMAYHVIRAVI